MTERQKNKAASRSLPPYHKPRCYMETVTQQIAEYLTKELIKIETARSLPNQKKSKLGNLDVLENLLNRSLNCFGRPTRRKRPPSPINEVERRDVLEHTRLLYRLSREDRVAGKGGG